MTNQELMIFLKEMNNELDEIWNEYCAIDSQINEDNFDEYATCYPDIFDSNIERYAIWKNNLIPKLHGSYQVRVKRINYLNNISIITFKYIYQNLVCI